jgi:hypothetical protein
MKILAVDLYYPENTTYVSSDKVGSFLLGRLLKRHPLFAVHNGNKVTPIVLTSGDISVIQKEVDEQVKALESEEKDLGMNKTQKTLVQSVINYVEYVSEGSENEELNMTCKAVRALLKLVQEEENA